MRDAVGVEDPFQIAGAVHGDAAVLRIQSLRPHQLFQRAGETEDDGLPIDVPLFDLAAEFLDQLEEDLKRAAAASPRAGTKSKPRKRNRGARAKAGAGAPAASRAVHIHRV